MGLGRSFSGPGLALALDLFIHLYPRVLRGAAKLCGRSSGARPGFWARVVESKRRKRPGEASELGLPCNHIVEPRFLPPASVTSPVKWKQWYSTSRGDS